MIFDHKQIKRNKATTKNEANKFKTKHRGYPPGMFCYNCHDGRSTNPNRGRTNILVLSLNDSPSDQNFPKKK